MDTKIITCVMDEIVNGSLKRPILKMISEDTLANLPRQLSTLSAGIVIVFAIIKVTGVITIKKSKTEISNKYS